MKHSFITLFIISSVLFSSCKENQSEVHNDDHSDSLIVIGGLFSLTGNWNTLGKDAIAAAEIAINQANVIAAERGLSIRFSFSNFDTKLIPVNENYRYNIAGLNLGYEPGMKAKNATENLLKSLSNPVDLVYSLFNSKEKDFKKLIILKNDAHFASILSNNTNREVLFMLLQLDKNEIDKILEKCNYSKSFINTASDLQVLDALASSYNDYKVLKRK